GVPSVLAAGGSKAEGPAPGRLAERAVMAGRIWSWGIGAVAGAVVLGLLAVLILPLGVAMFLTMAMTTLLASCGPGDSGGGVQTAGGGESVAVDAADVGDSNRPVISTLPSPDAIPQNYFSAYKAVAESYGIDWETLAAIGYQES